MKSMPFKLRTCCDVKLNTSISLFEVVFVSKNKNRQSIPEKIGLPAEVLPNAARVTVSGTSEAYIENHGGLKQLTDGLVEIRSRNGSCCIKGRDLKLAYMTKDKIVVRGLIVVVEFM